MRRQIDGLGYTPDVLTTATELPSRPDWDPLVHRVLEHVLPSGRINDQLRQEGVVPEKDVEALLLAREQRRVELAEVVTGLLALLQRIQNEAILKPDRVARVALTALELVVPGFQDPEVGRTGAGIPPTLSAVLRAAHPPEEGL
jgi:hypothetical protein